MSFLGGWLRALDVYSLGVGFGPLDWHSVLGAELTGPSPFYGCRVWAFGILQHLGRKGSLNSKP